LIGDAALVDCGKELFRDGDWTLYVDYKIVYDRDGLPSLINSKDRFIAIGHFCGGTAWRTVVDLGIGGNQCRNCEERVPEALKGLKKLAEWDR
jgi:hypothetical protein